MGNTKNAKKSDKPLIRQIMDLIPTGILERSVERFSSDKHCHKYKTHDQLVAMMFGQ